jgi:hypothetical protein
MESPLMESPLMESRSMSLIRTDVRAKGAR